MSFWSIIFIYISAAIEKEMISTLSVRSYSHQTKGHSHNFHQIVLPLRGVINIKVENYIGKVTPIECVVVKAYEKHYFNAEENAKFIEPPRLYRRLIYLSQAATPDRIKLS